MVSVTGGYLQWRPERRSQFCIGSQQRAREHFLPLAGVTSPDHRMPQGIKTVFTREYACVLEVLVHARKQRGLTQRDVAKALGRPQSFVSKYENGERRLDIVEFFGIIRTLDGNPLTMLVEMGFIDAEEVAKGQK